MPEGVFPAVVVPPGTGLHNLAANARLVRTLTRTVPGVVVADAGRVIGFVSRADLVDALLFDSGLRCDTGSDPLLHGEPRAVSDAVRIRCLTCGMVNKYDYCLPGDRKDCANGHPLDADLE
ncbi:CBS domain-containing protein [Streptomyces collinus]|uniref:CBS domain-containing protein n=1 Tax=Streptomyces collinus TaxID=42684 RepID=UPI0036CD0C0E